MTILNNRPFIITATLLFLVALQSYSQIQLSGDFQTGSPTPTLTITEDISFDIIATGPVGLLVFDEWVTSDGGTSEVTFIPQPQNLTYSLNGGSAELTQAAQLFDNSATANNDLSANDGWIEFISFEVTAGDTVTIGATTFTSNQNTNFNPALSGSFTGNVFLADIDGNRLSALTPIPEPAAAMLLGLAACFVATSRRCNRGSARVVSHA